MVAARWGRAVAARSAWGPGASPVRRPGNARQAQCGVYALLQRRAVGKKPLVPAGIKGIPQQACPELGGAGVAAGHVVRVAAIIHRGADLVVDAVRRRRGRIDPGPGEPDFVPGMGIGSTDDPVVAEDGALGSLVAADHPGPHARET